MKKVEDLKYPDFVKITSSGQHKRLKDALTLDNALSEYNPDMHYYLIGGGRSKDPYVGPCYNRDRKNYAHHDFSDLIFPEEKTGMQLGATYVVTDSSLRSKTTGKVFTMIGRAESFTPNDPYRGIATYISFNDTEEPILSSSSSWCFRGIRTNDPRTYRRANALETAWLDACIKAGKYIPQEEVTPANKDIPIEKPSKFVIGQWYKLGDNYGKLCGKVIGGGEIFPATEFIHNGKYKNDGSVWRYWEAAVICPLSEIQQYLPNGHVDKLPMHTQKSKAIIPVEGLWYKVDCYNETYLVKFRKNWVLCDYFLVRRDGTIIKEMQTDGTFQNLEIICYLTTLSIQEHLPYGHIDKIMDLAPIVKRSTSPKIIFEDVGSYHPAILPMQKTIKLRKEWKNKSIKLLTK